MRRGAIVEEDDAVGEGFGGEELEADESMARLNQGDAFADDAKDGAELLAGFRAARVRD